MLHCLGDSMKAREGKQTSCLWLCSQALDRSQPLLHKEFMALWTNPRKHRETFQKIPPGVRTSPLLRGGFVPALVLQRELLSPLQQAKSSKHFH